MLIDLFPVQDVTSLTPLSPEIISRQATINIGMELKHNLIRFLVLEHKYGNVCIGFLLIQALLVTWPTESPQW